MIPMALFLVTVFVVFFISETSLSKQGGDTGNPITNAAMYPRLIAGILLLLAITQFINEFILKRSPLAGTHPTLSRLQIAQIVISVAGFTLYLIILPVVGYHVTTPLLIAVLLVVFGIRKPLHIIAYPLVLSLGCAVVFEGLFNVNLPRGIFGLAFSL